jgi:hypothetical protein
LLREHAYGGSLEDEPKMAARFGALLSADAMKGLRPVGEALIAAPLHPFAPVALSPPVLANVVRLAWYKCPIGAALARSASYPSADLHGSETSNVDAA